MRTGVAVALAEEVVHVAEFQFLDAVYFEGGEGFVDGVDALAVAVGFDRFD